MKVYRFVAYSVIFLFFIFVSLPAAMAVSFTFSGTYDGQPRLFPVSSVGYNKPPYPLHTSNGATLWSWDWQINSISNWALLDYPGPNNYVNNDPSSAQLLYGAPYNEGTDWGFEYTEDLGGNNTSTSKYWEQLINIGALTSFNTLADLLGVSGGFMYHEATVSGSAIAGPFIERVNLPLTLIAFDLSDTGPDPAPGPAPVPEPSSMLLLGSGWIGLWGFRKKFRK